MEIQHLTHNEINTLKWDKSIRDSFNGVIFAFSWYLDIIAEDWEALVSEDYEYVMPLPLRHIMGITYVEMPKFSVHLGVFTKKMLDEKILHEFLEKIPYPCLGYALNVHNPISVDVNFKVKNSPSYRLDMISSYSKAKQRYTTEFNALLVKSISSNVAVQNGLSPNSFVDFMQNNAQLKNKLHQDKVEILRRLAVNAVRYRVGVIYGAYSANNNLSAAALLIGSHNKAYFVAAGASKQGIKENAMALLLNVYLEQQAEYNLTILFEGLNLPDREKFITGIGAKRYSQYTLEQNNLPWYLKVVKI